MYIPSYLQCKVNIMLYKIWIFAFFLIIFVTTCLSDGSYYCGTGFTNLTEFECKEASDCISNNKVCDGIKDCADGSDEESCYNYKAKSSNCVLPPYTNHGSYEVFNLPKYRLKDLGQPFESFMLKLRCDPGYIVEPGYGLDVNGTWELFCNNGVWSQTMPQCVRKLLRSARMMDINQKSFCKLDPDPSVHYMCSEKVCNNSVPAGTIVNPICNYPIYIPTEGQKLVYMTCNAGVWDHIVRCEADCGRVTPIGVGLVIDGKPVIHGELPSHVGIYRKPRPYKQICGGSLISNDVVISAAHCFWGATEVQPASNFIVAVGKLYREWYDKRDNDAQKSHVIKIIIPSLFGGATASFQEDIAALILRTSVTYKLYVRPVCISYNDIFDRLQLQDGNLGKVAGWGLTGANGDFSPYLKVVQMPFINEATCINTLPSTFRPYVTGDKFCAGYTNGTGVCKGDSGGGLVFSEYSQGLDRYYLRGVVSTAPPTEGQRCNDKSYTTFTKITKHQDLIQNALAEAYTLKRCEPGQGEYCSPNPEFVDDLDELNKSSEEVEGSTKPGDCILPPYPTYGTYQAFPNARPGAALDSFVLTVCCRKGFDLVDPDSGNETSNQVHCINGTYQQKMPKCTRFCQLNPDASVRYLCPVPGGGSETCRKYVAPGTMVTVICNEPMYSNRYHIENTSKCNSSGYFDYLLSCEVECGRETFESGPSVNGANAAKKGEVPWHVGIYQKTTTPYQQICGGTIIRNNLVLSSTVCFLANDMKTLHPTSNYAVAAGKLYREWNSDRDADAQTSDIKDLKTASEGVYFLRSIAIIVLETPFVYTPYIRPVCLLNLQVISILLLIKTKPDKVAGWGLTSANGNASDFLQITTLVSAKDCLRDVKSYIEYYDSWDKGCARHFSGKPICDGDSGGGLTFSDQLLDYNYIKRYYLKGIVSTAPIDEDKKCTDRAPISFTKVFNHGEFIHEVIENYTEKKCNQSEFRCDDGSCAPQGADCNGVRQCKDGSDEADELCIPVFKL